MTTARAQALNTQFPKISHADPIINRIQDNIASVLGPLATAVNNTPITQGTLPMWVNLTLQNGWSFDSSWLSSGPSPQYNKDVLGYVHVKGIISGLIPAGSIAPILQDARGALPPGFRPKEVHRFAQICGASLTFGNSSASVIMNPDGTLEAVQSAVPYLWLDFTFLAEN